MADGQAMARRGLGRIYMPQFGQAMTGVDLQTVLPFFSLEI